MVAGAVPDRDPPDRRRTSIPVEKDRRRSPHVDHADPFREPTRPGPHLPPVELLDLDRTQDDAEHAHLTPVEGIAIDAVNEAARRLEQASHRTALEIDVRADARVAELAELHGSTWARGVDADIAALKAATARPPRRELLKTAGKWLTGGGVLGALLIAINALIAHGNGQAVSRAERQMLHRHDWQMDRVVRALERVAGKLGIDLHIDDTAPKDSP